MPRRSRRRFLAACAALLYGARTGFATEAPASLRRVGVLLPLGSSAFGRAAEAVKQGFERAAKLEAGAAYEITIYSTTEDPGNIFTGYERALAEAPSLIVGPLTRNGVTALLPHLRPSTPLLALNVPEEEGALPPGMLAFSLQVESEARQIANLAFADGRRTAITIVDEQPLMQRIERAFVDEFLRAGGRVPAQFVFSTNPADLLALREAATTGRCDSVFLALDGVRARWGASFVQGPAQLYATSQILSAQKDRLRDGDLNGVRFVAMPWLLERDHPAVMVYAASGEELPAATDLERLYAFGIDAYRLASAYLQGNDLSRNPLDGVTGRIQLQWNGYFVRELTPAQFVEGRPLPLRPRP